MEAADLKWQVRNKTNKPFLDKQKLTVVKAKAYMCVCVCVPQVKEGNTNQKFGYIPKKNENKDC